MLDRMRPPVFEQAPTRAEFAAVSVAPDTGTVIWPVDADLAPDPLDERGSTGLWLGQPACA